MRWPEDFRENLIVDRDCPILIQKAWRDHDREGWAYLAAEYEEDALTWNVFRSLDPAKGEVGPGVIREFFGLEDTVEEVLFWGCDPDGTSPAQQDLSILIRGLDGKRLGTMTEPDLVVITGSEVCFVECKLRFRPSPWTAKATIADTVPGVGGWEGQSQAEVAGPADLGEAPDGAGEVDAVGRRGR